MSGSDAASRRADDAPDRPDASSGRRGPDGGGALPSSVHDSGVGDLLADPRVLVDAVVPPLLFVAVNAAAGLRWAAVASLGFALVMVAWRVVAGQRLLFAVSGLVGAAVSVGLALVSGRASAYFVPGIVSNLAFAVACVVSVIVRRPLIAWTSQLLYRWPWAWYLDDRVRPAYSEITWLWALVYVARAGAQAWLATRDAVGALAVVRVVTGTPIFIVLLAVTYAYVNRRLRTLGAPPVDAYRADDAPPVDAHRGDDGDPVA